MFSGMFGWSAPADPKEQVKKWKSELRSEGRKLERQINSARHTAAAQFRGRAARWRRGKKFQRPPCSSLSHPSSPRSLLAEIQREEQKVKGEVKKAAKRGDQDVAKTLAREIVRSRKACNRLHVSKTQLNSVMMQMEQQLAQQKMLGTMQKSAVVMGAMNKLVKVGAIAEVMQNMQKEMCKAGIIEEMVDDAMSSLEGEDEEDAADAEVEQVMQELNAETMGSASSAPSKAPVQAQAAADDEEDAEAEAEMQRRLAELRAAS